MTEPGQAGRGGGRVVRRFAYLLGAFGLREILQTLFTIYLARKEAATFGQFFLGLSLGQLVLFVSEFGLNQHLVVLLAQDRRRSAQVLVQASLLKAALLLLTLAGLAGFVYWQGYPPGLRLVVLVLAAGLGLEALSSTFYAWMQFEGRQAQEAGARAGASLLGFGHGFAALYLGAAAGVVAAYRLLESLASLAVCLGQAAGLLRWREVWTGWSAMARTWAGSLVFTAMAGASILYNRLNIIWLQSQASDEAVAQYGVTWQLVDGLAGLVATLLLKNVMLPRFLKLWTEDRPAFLALARETAHWLMAGSLALAFLLMALSEPLLGLLYGPAYARAAQLQKWLSPCLALGIMHNLAGFMMIAMGGQMRLLSYFLVVLAFNLLACLALIPGHPLEGAVGAIVASKVLLALLSLGHCQRRLGLWPWPAALRLLAAGAAGGAIYAGLAPWLTAAGAAAPALLPLALLAWRERPAASRGAA